MPSDKYPLLRLTRKGHSFFDLISEFGKSEDSRWDRAFHRLCSLMRKMAAQNVVIEQIEDYSPNLREEKAALDTYYGKDIKFEVFRFTFLLANISTLAAVGDLKNRSFLASATLINFTDQNDRWHSYLQEAIVCRPQISGRLLLNNYVHIRNDFNCSVNFSKKETRSFKINGTFFCQQNAVTSVCAHASLCMLINNMNAQKMITTEWINKILEIDHIKKRVSTEGLNTEQVLKVLKNAGLEAEWHNFFDHPNIDYAQYIYRYIEGGCPSLLVFTTKYADNEEDVIEDDDIAKIPLHVVPVIGHTLNSDIWEAEAELAYNRSVPLNYRPASEWVDHFIIHDDNFGMYLCLPVDSLRKITLPKYDPTLRAYLAIVVTPITIQTSALQAEWAGAALIRKLLKEIRDDKVDLGIWLERLADKSIPMIIRTMLMNKKNYKKHLEKEKDFKGNCFTTSEVSAVTQHLPSHFWLSEITIPDLYTANKHKILDFIYPCDKPPDGIIEKEIPHRWIQIRLPGVCYFNGEPPNVIPLTVKSHFPLYRHEKDSKVPEW